MSTSFARQIRRRFSRWWIALALAAVGLVGGFGCGDDGEQKAGEGESCGTSKDCKSELICRQEVCIRPGGADAGTDATDADVVEDGSSTEQPEPEDYYISYVLEPGENAPGELHLYNTADDSDVVVSPDGMNCSFNCWVSKDLNHFVHAKDAGGGNLDIYVSELDSELKAKGEGEKLVGPVQDVSVRGNIVTYRKTDGSASNVAFYKPLSGGSEKTIGQIEEGTGDWFVDPKNDIAVRYSEGNRPVTLDMTIGKASNRDSDTTYTFDGTNFKGQGGGYFDDNILTATSQNGTYLGLVLSDAPNDYQSCTRESSDDPWSSDECNSEKAYQCGDDGRCTRLEATVHVIEVAKKDNLGQSCEYGKDGACGDIHECDAPSDQKASEAVCIPRRTVIGVPTTKQGPERTKSGCELVERDDSIHFTETRGPLSFDDDGNAYLVGERDRSCIRSQFTEVPMRKRDNIGPNSYAVKVDPTSGEYELLEGLPSDKLFSPGECYNDKEEKLELREACTPWIDRVRVSPGGDEVAYTATNPNTSSWARSNDTPYLWHMLSDGSERWFTGDAETDTAHTTTQYLQVHPAPEN